MKLICGLGNPGPNYTNHRHNVGYWVVEMLAKKSRLKWEEGSSSALETWGTVDEEECWLMKPLTWMNSSGLAAKVFLKEKKIEIKDLIVIHDDIDLALGKMRWSFGAGHGGHNGVRSIIDSIGTQEFYRLRLGIGRPPHVSLGRETATDPAEYVLQPFMGPELDVIEKLTEDAVQSLRDFLKHGLEWVQNRYH